MSLSFRTESWRKDENTYTLLTLYFPQTDFLSDAVNVLTTLSLKVKGDMLGSLYPSQA